MLKGIGTGILAGVIIWGVLFLPMNYCVIQPALSNMVNSLSPNISDYMLAELLLGLFDVIIVGSLALHILFGGSNGILF
jgi:hypothetical protein